MIHQEAAAPAYDSLSVFHSPRFLLLSITLSISVSLPLSLSGRRVERGDKRAAPRDASDSGASIIGYRSSLQSTDGKPEAKCWRANYIRKLLWDTKRRPKHNTIKMEHLHYEKRKGRDPVAVSYVLWWQTGNLAASLCNKTTRNYVFFMLSEYGVRKTNK